MFYVGLVVLRQLHRFGLSVVTQHLHCLTAEKFHQMFTFLTLLRCFDSFWRMQAITGSPSARWTCVGTVGFVLSLRGGPGVLLCGAAGHAGTVHDVGI